MRGTSGLESVTIIDGGTHNTMTLTKEYILYETKNPHIYIIFNNDWYSRDVHFKSEYSTRIHSSHLDNWNCNSNCGGNCHRCSSLLDGKFAWGGMYSIEFKGR